MQDKDAEERARRQAEVSELLSLLVQWSQGGGDASEWGADLLFRCLRRRLEQLSIRPY